MNKLQKRIVGWACIVIGLFISAGMVLRSLDQPPGYGYIMGRFSWSAVGDFFRTLLVNPFFYGGLVLVVAGLVIMKGEKK